MSELFTDADIIYAYTREDAIADGVLVDANVGEFAEITRQHFKMPVAMTAGVFALIEKAVKNPDWCNDYKGVWHDICWMCRYAIKNERASGSSLTFPVIITGVGRTRKHHLRATVGAVGPTDPAPCLTIMLINED
jgi:hypothetical protein